jgi:VIT1/CCC1 family predicted Fe2+/Mn2+ transporter
MDGKTRYLEKLYKNEMLHQSVYESLSRSERDPGLKAELKKLSMMEAGHKTLWGKILQLNRIPPPDGAPGMMAGLILAVRRIFGLALTVKFIEYFENRLEDKFDMVLKTARLDKKESAILKRIKRDEELHERSIEEKVISYGKIIANIRDVAFGINDGLVELLAVVVGLAAAINNPLVVLLGGFIVAVSGTLSMAGGAYLSTEYEESIKAAKKTAATTPMKSAFYVGVMYFIGTLFPLSPFFLGVSGFAGIVAAIIITVIVLALTSTFIAIVSDTSITGRVSKTLFISLGIDVITIAIGVYARSVLNLPP